MLKAELGRTGIWVNKDGFGALPLQRMEMEEAVRLLHRALDGGIDFIDTARGYTDSEEKIGRLAERRGDFILATKTMAKTVEGFWKDLDTSLSTFKTDWIDLYQFHNPDFVPKPEDGTGLYEAMIEARKQGKIRFIGLTNHRLPVAREAVESGLYDTLQFPFNYLSSKEEIALVKLCEEWHVGFIAMKALSGGLITDIFAARGWLAGLANVVPIWGIQREKELTELFEAQEQGFLLSPAQEKRIEEDRRELAGSFCRGCGYCMPCPEGIQISVCARIVLLLKRAPSARWLSETWQKEMAKIENCRHCGQCSSRCPYSLDTPALLGRNYEEYKMVLSHPVC